MGRLHGRTVIVVASVLCSVGLAPGLSAAQEWSEAAYYNLLRTYARAADASARAASDRAEAVVGLMPWPVEHARGAARTLVDDRDRRIAAMLHTETALMVSPATAAAHLEIARELLQPAAMTPQAPSGRSSPAITAPAPAKSAAANDRRRVFAARWLGFAPLVYLWHGDTTRAQRTVNLGLPIAVGNLDARFAQGAILEDTIRQLDRRVRDPNDGVRIAQQLDARLMETTQLYARIVAERPDSMEAHLRLGRVLMRNNSPRSAREHLDLVTRKATRPELQYLAHLFLSTALQEAHQLDAAHEHARRARAISPSQSALIALMRIETARGNLTGLRDVGRAFASTAADRPPDPWSDYLRGHTGGALFEWLLSEAFAD